MSSLKEGSIYKTLNVEGKKFEIFYGYYCDAERELWEPTPIFPDFTKSPQFTDDGMPYVTAEQDICEHYEPKERVSGENWCDDCAFFLKGEEIIGVCRCNERKNIIRKDE